MSFRNRMNIASAQGPQLLSIPLAQGRDQRVPVAGIRIANKYRWQDQHWKSLYSCYNRSPWFEYYQPELEQLYREPVDSLVEWNLRCFRFTLRQLKWNIEIGFTEGYQPFYESASYHDWRNKLVPKTMAGMTKDLPAYTQVFAERTGFLPGLSILDLLFCEGPRAGTYLSRS